MRRQPSYENANSRSRKGAVPASLRNEFVVTNMVLHIGELRRLAKLPLKRK